MCISEVIARETYPDLDDLPEAAAGLTSTFEFVAAERPGVVAEKGRLNFAPVGFVP
jgi:hypothetical protein